MRRFYCKICKSIRHVRRMPLSVNNPFAYAVTDRIGECNWHSRTTPRVARPASTHQTIKKVVVSVPKSRKAGR